MEENKFTLSSFIQTNELNEFLAVFDEKYSKTFVIDNAYSWIINSLKVASFSALALFESQQTKNFDYEEIISVIEQFVASKILVQVS